MSNEKISQLNDGSPAQASDLIPIARGTLNFSLTAQDIANLSGSLPLTGGTMTGTLGIGGGVAVLWSSDTGISRVGIGSLAVGNGAVGDTSGTLALTNIMLSDFGVAPTSLGTAGTVGQIVQHGGVLYFCSSTGVAGSATWNTVSMVAV